MSTRRTSQTSRAQAGHRKHKADNETYVHLLRTGAVAAGLGAAVVAGHGVAAATPAADGSGAASDAGPASSSTGSSTGSSPGGSAPSGSSGHSDPATSSGTAEPEAATDSRGTHGSSGHGTREGMEPSGGTPAKDSGVDEDLVNIGVDATGPTAAEAAAQSEEPAKPAPVAAAPGEVGTPPAETDIVVAPAPHSGASTEPVVVSTPGVTRPETGPDTGSDTSATDTASAASKSSTSATTTSRTANTATGTESNVELSSPLMAALSSSTVSSSVSSVAAAVPEPVHVPTFLTAPVTVRSIVSDVLTWLRFAPLATDAPIPPAPVPSLLESLWLVVRRFQYTANNQRPTAQPTISAQNSVTGVITGKLNTTDYDDDHLTYTVTGAPAHGTVALDAAGNFTYTPAAALAETGGRDQFTVTIDDRAGNPWHLHGRLDVLGCVLNTTATVKVTFHTFADRPETIAFNPDGTRAYVTWGGGPHNGSVAVIDIDPAHTGPFGTYNTVIASAGRRCHQPVRCRRHSRRHPRIRHQPQRHHLGDRHRCGNTHRNHLMTTLRREDLGQCRNGS